MDATKKQEEALDKRFATGYTHVAGAWRPSAVSTTNGTSRRHLRTAKGLSQESFAHLCELDRTYVGGIERGERNPTLKNLQKIADALNISISELTKDI